MLTADEKTQAIQKIDALINDLNDAKFRVNGGAPGPIVLKLQKIGRDTVDLAIAVTGDTFD